MRRVRRFLPLLLSPAFSFLAFGTPQNTGDEILNTAARELADKVLAAGLMSRRDLPIQLLAVNHSSISSGQFEAGVREFQAELQARSIRTERGAAPAADLRVFLTESLEEYIWVALTSADDDHPAMLTSVPRSALILQTASASPKTSLRKRLLLSRPEPILDLLFYKLPETGEQRLLALQPEQVLILRLENDSWTPETRAALQHDESWPRDLRGRIVETFPDRLQAFFPDAVCDLKRNPTWGTTCSGESTEFPLFSGSGFKQIARFAPKRNYFSSSEVEGKQQLGSTPAYVTAVIGWGGDGFSTISTQLDGTAVLVENPPDRELGDKRGGKELVATHRSWGSDIASLATDCGQKWQVLATRAGDSTEADAIQAFEIVDRQPVAVSDAVDFPGPVTALWESGSGAEAIAVVKNLKTGLYDGYSLSLTCSQ